MAPTAVLELNLVLALAVLTAVSLLSAHQLARRRLYRFTRHEVREHSGEDAAMLLAVRLNAIVKAGDDPYFVAPPLRFLGAAPGAVLKHGGCCSGMHRLYITALDTIGIPASQITLYHRNGMAQHCLAEVIIGGKPVIVDACYGVVYRTARGHPIGLEDLQRGAIPCFVPLGNGCGCGYPDNDYYNFNFRLTRTANWTKSRPRRAAYWLLNQLTSGGVDRLRLPALLEWPHILTLLMVLPLFVAMCVARAWLL